MAHAADNTSTFGPEQRLTGAYLVIALLALFVGVVTGLFQALSHAGINLYAAAYPSRGLLLSGPYLARGDECPGVDDVFYLRLPPVHSTRALERPLASRGLAWATYGLMTGGLVLAAIPLLGNAATVMFTFYPPLRAHWAFYVGLTLVVVGTWLVTLNLVLTYRAWRAAASWGADPTGRVHGPGDVCHVVHRLARAGGRNAGHAHPVVAGVAAGNGSPAGTDAVLVHRASHRLFLAPADVHLLVHPDPAASRGAAL